MKRVIAVLVAAVIIGVVIKVTMGELAQSPEAAQNAAFLHTGTAFKIIESGEVTLSSFSIDGSTTSNSVSTSVTHNLGFTPIVMAFKKNNVTGSITPFISSRIQTSRSSGGLIQYFVQQEFTMTVTSTTVRFFNSAQYWGDNTFGDSQTLQSVTVKYYLCTEQAI